MKFSVVIPMYNAAGTIQTALRSVVNQVYPFYEIIVVDDGSSDDSAEAVEAFSREHGSIRLRLVQQPNQGPSVARNHGLELAEGEYVAFLDSDDGWSPYFLAKARQLLEFYPDVGILGTEAVHDQELPAAFLADLPQHIPLTIRNQLFSNYFCTSSTIIKKEVYQRMGGFNEKMKYGEDYEYWLRILCQYPALFITEPLVRKNRMMTSLSSRMLLMEKGELSIYSRLRQQQIISSPQYVAVTAFSLAKFFRRLLINSLREVHYE